MSSTSNTPIRRQLMLILLSTSAVVMLLMWGAFFSFEYLTFRRATMQEVSTIGRLLASNSTAALAFDNPDDAREILSSLKAQAHVTSAALYDRRGRLFATYPTDTTEAPQVPGTVGYRFAGTRLTGFTPVTQGSQALGTLFISLDIGTVTREWFINSTGIALGVIAIVFAIAYWLARGLQKRISGPILSLAGTARAVTERSDYSVRAAVDSGGELRLLTDTFNSMLAHIERLNREMEQRVVERTAQLESANKELESFSYSVSHDLRAPLRHIDGFAQLLRKQIEGKMDDTAKRYLDTIETSARRLGLLIDELLVFSRMGRSEMRRSPVDFRVLVDEVLLELEPETQNRRIQWRIGVLPAVHGDRSMLRQVWANLIGNAVKYTRRKDTAVIEISHRLDPAEGHVFSINDNGAGFDMEYSSKLFGVFQRLHSASEFEGTGIGLANVRRIVGRHGGRVWAEGRPNEGATFYFTLPASPPTDPLIKN